MKKHEVIIIGGGPGGSVLASYLAKQKVDVAVFEQVNFPRFHIGESLLPFSMDIFREIGFFDTLDSGKYMRKFGAQFIHHSEDEEIYFEFQNGLDNNHGMAFEVERAEFDHDLLKHAQKLGATIYQPETIKDVVTSSSGVTVKTNKGEYEAKYIADCSGRNAFLGKKNKLRHPNADLNNIGVFAHYSGVERFAGKREGDITIGLLEDQRWVWIIPFVGDKTSVGVVGPSRTVAATALDNYIEEAIATSPVLKKRLANAERITEVSAVSNYSNTSEAIIGDRWILCGDAAMFLDPIFSSGVHVSISTGKFASELLIKALNDGISLCTPGMGDMYEKKVRTGVDRFHSLISLFYGTNFVRQMKKTFHLKNTKEAFTSIVAGDVWNDENFVFSKGVL